MPRNYSNSRIETFNQCRLKYDYKYIKKIATDIPTTIEAFMGTIVHETLRKLYQDRLLGKIPTIKQLLEFYKKEWENNYSVDTLIAKAKPMDYYKEKGTTLVAAYYAQNHPFNQSQTLGLETEEFLPLNDSINYHIRIDRLAIGRDKSMEIHDYKTSNRLKTQFEADEDKQLAMYSSWVQKKFPNYKIKLVWHFLNFNKKIESSRTTTQLELLKKQILKKIEEIESATEFPASTGPLCNYCEFHKICPAFSKNIF